MKVIALLLLIVLAMADNCGGNCPSGKCPNCPCGTTKYLIDIATWCAKYNGWNQVCCKCIVSHSSGGNAYALNYNTNNSLDVGVWQINSSLWSICSNGHAPCDATSNLNCAIEMYLMGGNSFKMWAMHTACGC